MKDTIEIEKNCFTTGRLGADNLFDNEPDKDKISRS